MYRHKLAISCIILFLFSANTLGAPGDVLKSLSINNVSGDGRTPTSPQGITTHDGYLWVVDFGTDRIYRVYPEDVYDDMGTADTSDDTLLFSAGDSDLNIPLADTDNPPINSDGTPIPTCGASPAGQYCGGGGLTFAENYLWNASPITDDIIKVDPVDGDNLESENALASLAFPSPTDMTYDGSNFWIVDWQTNTISKVRPEDGAVLLSLPGPSSLPSYQSNPSVTNARPYGITWDGRDLWVADQEEQKIFRIDVSDGSVVDFFATPGADPKGLSWNGEFLWHTDQTTGTLYAIETGVIPFGITGCLERNGVAVDAAILLSQAATSDKSTNTDIDGCFQFAEFTAGVPIQIRANEAGVDEKPVITLTETSPGSTDVTLIVGDIYSEPGYSANDTEDGDLTSEVVARPNVIDTPSIIDTSAPNSSGILVEYDVVDSSGNNADTITRTVYVLEADITAPVITLIGNDPTYVEQGSSYSEPGATAIDNRDGDISANIIITGTVNANVAGSYSLSYDVSDAAGNAASTVTREVIVQDTTIPVITLLGDTTVTLEKGDTYTEAGASASDNVDGDISASIVISGSVISDTVGSYVVNYNVADSSGNAAATVSRTVNVVDTTIPVITLIGPSSYNQELNTTFVDPGATASDVPSEDLTSSIVVTGTVNTNTAGTYTLSYDVTDTEGNAATTVIREVVVSDTGAPSIALLGDNPLAHELGNAYVDPGATATDAIDGDLSASIVVGGDIVNPNQSGSYSVTYNVSDSVGNPALTQTRTVNVSDTTPPTITLNGDANVLHELQTPYTDAGASASDNTDGDISASIIIGGDTVDANTPGVYSITYNVSDAAGNPAAPLTRIVEVADRTAPIITLVGTNPLDHEVGTVFVDPGATASDVIDGNLTANIGVSGSVDPNTIGAYTLNYNVSDAAGNPATTVSRIVNVVDTGAPSIVLNGDNPVLHELQTPYSDAGASATDAADGDLTSSIVVTGSVDVNIAGTYTLSYDVVDSQSNAAATIERSVIVADRTIPVITLIGNSTINVDQNTSFSDPGASASDNIDGDLSGSLVVTGGVDINTAGTYTINYNVSDAAGNAATQVSRTVIVSDTTIPTIVLNGDNPLDHEVGTIFVDPGATATDNIDGDISVNISVTGTVNANTQGSYSLMYNVADSSGNSATPVTRIVNVVDTGAPSIVLNGTNPTLHELQTTYTDAGATASDAVDGDLTSSINVSGSVNPNLAGTYTLSYNVSDSQGNPAPTVSREVIVADRTAPIITLTGSATVNAEQGSTYVDAGATAADAIDGDLSASIVVGGSVNTAVSGSYQITYNVSDSSGNPATQIVRTVIVADTINPTITLVGDDPLNHPAGTVFVDPGATANDNIDGDISSNISVIGSVDPNTIGAYLLQYNVADSSGNPAVTVTRTVNVSDTGAPVITITGDNPLYHNINTPYIEAGATASDATDGDVSADIIIGGDTVDPTTAGTYLVTYDVSDSIGNPAAQQTRTVNVGDFEAPTITLLGNATVNVEIGTSYTDAGATATDNIDGSLTSSIVTSGSVDPLTAGTYIISYDVSDAAGNSATQVTRTVVVSDTTAPVITLIGASTINHEQGSPYTDPGASATDSYEGDLSASINVTGFVSSGAAGTYTLNYNVSDSAGNNASTVTRTVIVADTTAPSLTLVGTSTINHEKGSTYSDPGATAIDNINGNISANIVVTGSVDSNTAGTYILNYSVSDSSGNSAPSLSRTVVVADTTAPTIQLIGESSINHEQGTAYIDQGATASDSADGDLSASITTTGSVNTNTAGTYNIDYDVSDSAGNAATTVTRQITVGDFTKPVLTLLGNSIINHPQGVTYSDPGATALDNIDGDITPNITTSGIVNTSTPGSYVITYDVNDAAGNAATSISRTINVGDSVPPVISLIGSSDIVIEQGSGSYTDAGATASDNVDGNLTSSIVVSGNTVDTNSAGVYLIRYDVSDSAGNPAAQVVRTVTVQDTTAPTITLVGNATINHTQGTTYVDPGATANDSAQGDITANIVTTGSVDISTIGSYTLTYNVSDSAGNAATPVVRTVNVTDGIAPVISLNGNNPMDHVNGQLFVDPGATANDNLDGDISANIATSGSINVNTDGAYTLNYDVSDAAGNAAATVTRTVNVVTPASIFVEAESGTSVGGASFGSGGIFDSGHSGSGYYDIGPAQAGDYLEYTSVLAYGTTYNLSIRHGSISASNSVEVVLNGQSVGTISLPSTGGFFGPNYANSSTISVTPQTGANTIRFIIGGSSGNKRIDSFTLTPQ